MVKRQHYVWRKYLKPWTDNGDIELGKVFVYRKNPKGNQQKIQQEKIKDIGFEKYFYDMSGYSEKDINVYKQFLEYYQKDHSIKLELDIKSIEDAQIQRDFVETQIIGPFEDIDNKYKFLDKLYSKDTSFYKDNSKQEILNTLRDAIIKGIFSQEAVLSEDAAIRMAEKFFKNMDEPDSKYDFNLFFSMQYFRSPRIHSNLSKSFEDFKELSPNSLANLNTNFYVNLISLYFAQIMAINMTQKLNTSMILFDNKSSIPFVTGDTPIINISNKEDVAFFHYPITPRIAIGIVSNLPMKNITLEIDDSLVQIIRTSNQKLSENCVNEVYSNSQEVLEGIGESD